VSTLFTYFDSGINEDEKGTKTSESVNQTKILNWDSRSGLDNCTACLQPDSEKCTNQTDRTPDIFHN
jgi:hypothetical protein